MIKWNYESTAKSSSGYEDVMDKLKSYTSEKYKNADNEEKEKMIEEVFQIYRSKNIFPITYYNTKGIDEEIQKCINKDVEWEGNILNFRFTQGNSLCRFLFPNLSNVECKNSRNNTLINRFNNDHQLKRAIKLSLSIKKSVTPSELKGAIELVEHGIAANFNAMKAKALYERYCPENGIIYDFACGFGGRMLGALSSKKNFKYFGVEPCVETYAHLNELGLHIERNTGRENSYKIYCMGSEDYDAVENYADFAFSSPPYFNLEMYSDEPTQCYNKFNTLETWFDGYVEPTIKNIHKILKHGAYYAVNIADFNNGKNRVEYVDKWIELSVKCGFKYVEQIDLKLTTRSGEGHDFANEKKEGIFVFQKV